MAAIFAAGCRKQCDAFEYIEQSCISRMQQWLDAKDQKFLALTQLSAKTVQNLSGAPPDGWSKSLVTPTRRYKRAPNGHQNESHYPSLDAIDISY